MRSIRVIRSMLAFALALSLMPAVAFAKAPPPNASLAPMLKQVLPAVVNIATRSTVRAPRNPLLDDPFFRRFFELPNRPRRREAQSVGSGVIIDAGKGYVLTNHHVIDGADHIEVALRDRRSYPARVLGRDPEVDLALLQIEAEDLVDLPLADSDQLEIGDFVVAIGNPFGLGQTVTYGIVSALGRSGLGIEGFENFIQTDASINPGNSGGALITLDGKLVGINTAILGPNRGNVGIGFAIPINMAQMVTRQLIEHGSVERGQLGIVTQDLTPELAAAFGMRSRGGAVIAEVMRGSPAEKAGLQAGDMIVAINGRKIPSGDAARTLIGLTRIGSRVDIEVLRDGRRRVFEARIGEPRVDQADAGAFSPLLGGARLSEIPRQHPLHGRIEALLVDEVAPATYAAQVGLRSGDLILSINRQRVTELSDLRPAIERSPRELLLNIRRGNRAFFLVVR